MIIRTGAKPHTSISNQLLQDSRLSFEARGLAVYLLSKPKHWKIHVSDLRREGGIGRDKAYALMAELRDAGYLQRQQVRAKRGRMGDMENALSDQPLPENRETVKSPLPEMPDTNLPDTANPNAYKGQKERNYRKKENTECGENAQGDLIGDDPKAGSEPAKPSPARQAFDDYNRLAEHRGLAKAALMTKQRRERLNARLKDCGGIEGWRMAMKRASRSRFLMGKGDGKWKASLDFFLQPSSFTKLLEGQYDDSAMGFALGKNAPKVDRIAGTGMTLKEL